VTIDDWQFHEEIIILILEVLKEIKWFGEYFLSSEF
jgi:hypothetical protein